MSITSKVDDILKNIQDNIDEKKIAEDAAILDQQFGIRLGPRHKNIYPFKLKTETPAQLRIYSKGTKLSFDIYGGKQITYPYAEEVIKYEQFILQNINQVDRERVQIMPTFDGNDIIFAFGRHPRIYIYSGTLLNYAGDKDWVRDFLRFYENYRISQQLGKSGIHRFFIYYDYNLVLGHMLACNIDHSSMQSTTARVSFTVLVKEWLPVGDQDFTEIDWSHEPILPSSNIRSDTSDYTYNSQLIDIDKASQWFKWTDVPGGY